MFIDGVGLGPATPRNPLAEAYPGLSRLAGGQRWTREARAIRGANHVFHGIDANLGVDGLPQSGTGQATLFTGVNCAQLAGRHYGPFPHSATRETIANENIFSRVARLLPTSVEPAAFANAYPARFFEHVSRRSRWTVTTRACLDAGVRIRRAEDVVAGVAIAADITGGGWPQPDPPIDVISEDEAARRLLALSRQYAFTLFEYYLTDKAGHARDLKMARNVLASVDRLLSGILDAMDPTVDLLVVTSDHGNIEDLGSRSHTRNPVPLAAVGEGARYLSDVEDLTGVTPALLRGLRVRRID